LIMIEKPGFSCVAMAFGFAHAVHGATILVWEAKTRFLMP